MVKEWFKKRGRPAATAKRRSIDDLIVMERYEEAESELRSQLRIAEDAHARLKLAGVLTQVHRVPEAVDEYIRVAEQYSQDGFQRKATAALQRASKLDPTNQTLLARLRRVAQTEDLEHTRRLAVGVLKEANRTESSGSATAAIELEQIWDRLAKTEFVRQLEADQMLRLLSNMHLVRVQTDTALVSQGEVRPELFLIGGGEIEVSLENRGSRVVLRTFSAGDLVGESALLEQQKWPADYIATSSSSVLRLSREGLEATLVGNPDPRGLLDGLRQQGNDRALAQSIGRLGQDQGER